MSKNWSGYSTAHSVDSKKGPQNYHFSKHQKPKDRHSSISTSGCFFCENWTSNNPYFIQSVINRALYLKNFSLQKFFYTKDINDILAGKKNSKVVNFKDMQFYYDEREFLRQFYDKGEYEKRIKRLGEYYKFHQDIPRMFISSTAKIYGFYHDNKRRIDYYRISKMLKEREQSQKGAKKGEDQAGKKGNDSTIADKVLIGLDDYTGLDTRKSSIAMSSMNFTNKATTDNSPRKELCSKRPMKKSKLARKNSDTENTELDKRVDTVEDKSISKSIIELNIKLGEIINRSYSQSLNLDITSCFDQSHQLLNDKVIEQNNLFQIVDERNKNKKKSPLKTQAQSRPSVASEYYSQKLTNQDFDSVNANNNEEQNPIAVPLVSSATNQQAFRSSEWFQSLKKTVPSNLIRKRPNRLICTSKERIAQETRTALSSVKYSVDSVMISQNFNQSAAANFAKVKNFEEHKRRKQYNASADIRGHRSTSRDRTSQLPNNSSFLEKNGQGCKTQRDRSDENHVTKKKKKIDMLKTKIKLSGSNNMTYRDKRVNMFNKNSGSGSGMQHYDSQQMMMTADKDIYTSVNIKDLTQQVNQQGHKFISNTMQNVKITTKYGNIPIYQSVKENRKSHIMSTDKIVQESIQGDNSKGPGDSSGTKNVKDEVAVAIDSVYKNLVFDRPMIRVRGSTENLRKSKAMTHRDRDYELMPSRDASSEKNKKVTMYIMTKKDEIKAGKGSRENLESPDSDELRKFTVEEKNLKHEISSKDLVKFFVDQSQANKVKIQGEEKKRRAVSTEKFRPGMVGMVSSQSQNKLTGIVINSMRDHHEMNKDINNLYDKIYAKYAQGMSLKSVPKEGFMKAKAKGEMGKDGKVVVNTRCVKVDLHNSKEIMLGNSVENLGDNYGIAGHVKKGKAQRKNTMEI